MEYLISMIWVSAEFLCCIFFNGAFLEKRNKVKAQTVIVVAIWILMLLLAYSELNNILRQACILGLYTAASFVYYKGKILSHGFLSLICYVLVISIDTLFPYGVCVLLDITLDSLVWMKWMYTTVITIDKFLACFLAWLLLQIRKKKINLKMQGKWLGLTILFPAISVVIFLFMIFSYPGEQDISMRVIVFSIVLIISNIAILFVIDGMEKAVAKDQEVHLLRQQIAFQTDNFHALEKNYQIQRKSTHEFQRHIQALQDLMDQEEYSTAQDYLKRLHNNRSLKTFNIRSNHPVFDVILNQKHQYAQGQSVNMTVKVNDLSAVSIPTDTLVVLLSNLLDNAIEACQRLDGDKEIVCCILQEEALYISIRNTSLPVAIEEGKLPPSAKQSPEHGYGLSAVVYTLEQLQAEYTFTYQDGWFQFAAEIINLPYEEK